MSIWLRDSGLCADTQHVVGDDFAWVLAEAQTGNDDQFAVLWRDANPALLRYLRVLAPENADDIAAETWVHVVRGLTRFIGDYTENAFELKRFTMQDVNDTLLRVRGEFQLRKLNNVPAAMRRNVCQEPITISGHMVLRCDSMKRLCMLSAANLKNETNSRGFSHPRGSGSPRSAPLTNSWMLRRMIVLLA